MYKNWGKFYHRNSKKSGGMRTQRRIRLGGPRGGGKSQLAHQLDKAVKAAEEQWTSRSPELRKRETVMPKPGTKTYRRTRYRRNK